MRSPKQKWSWIGLILASIILLLVAEPAFTAPSQIDDREQGLRLLNLKRYQEAEKRFDQVLKTNPSDPKGYHYRGIARLYQDNLKGATKDLQEALKLTPTNTDVMASLGKVYFQSDQTAKAVKILDQAVKADPENNRAVNQLAWILAVTPKKKFRNGTRAVALAKRLTAKEENIHTLDTLAAAYAANKEYRKAVSTQEKALAILMKRSLTSEIDPYMERLKTYQQNQSWQHHKSVAKLPAKAIKKPSATMKDKADKPKVEKPVVKTPVKKNPVATPQPTDKTAVAKAQSADPNAAKTPTTDKPAAEKPVIKTPVVEKPVVTPQPTDKTAVVKAQATEPKATKTPTPDKPAVEKPVVKTPVVEKPVAKPQPTEKLTVTKIDAGIPKIPLVKKRRSSTLLAKKRLKNSSLQDKPSPPFYPYTIQIASFRDGQRAFYIANHLRQKGDPAFTGPVTLETSGNWYRVLFGWHINEDSAHKQLTVLKERQFKEPAVVKRPYAVLIESTKDMNRLERIERRLKEMGHLPYRLSDRKKKGYWRMLVGAYSDPSIPTDFAETLRQNGFQPVMVLR